MAKKLGARTVKIMNQAKQEVVRREETNEGEVLKSDLEKSSLSQAKNETFKSVGKGKKPQNIAVCDLEVQNCTGN